jgi:hypothetical protein
VILDVLPNKKPQANDYMHPPRTRSTTGDPTMTDEQPRTATGAALTNVQCDRVNFARRDYETARAEDLAQLPPANLILLVERMRGRLGDMLDLIDEVTNAQVPPSGV